MINKHILLFGGSGSLGNEFIQKYIHDNTIGFTDFEEGSKSEIFRRCDAGASNENITNYSRDECKHWQMSLQYKTANLKFIIGDIRKSYRLSRKH